VPLLIRAFTGRYGILFWKFRAKSEGSERSWTKHGKIIAAGCTTCYVL